MKFVTRDLTRMSIMAALTVISSFIAIPLGPVSVTLQTLFVLLTGLLFAPKPAFYTQLLNLFLMVLLRGPQVVMSPSFGFLVSFIVAATIMAWLKESGKVHHAGRLVLIGTVMSYIVGTPYMAFILNNVLALDLSFKDVLYTGVIIFLPGDALKSMIAVGMFHNLATIPSLQNSRKTH